MSIPRRKHPDMVTRVREPAPTYFRAPHHVDATLRFTRTCKRGPPVPAPTSRMHTGAVCAHVGPSQLPRIWMRVADASAGLSVRTVTHGGAPVAAASGCVRWVLLQYVQYQIYFCDI
jgi:hypothetical protein